MREPEQTRVSGDHLSVILVIDDSIKDRELLAKMLIQAGYQVYAEPDGESGVSFCQSHPPDLVLVDMVMPGMNGIEVLRSLKVMHPTIKVILCTAAGSEVSVALAMREGADGYVVKPYNQEKILMNIQRALGLI